MINQRCPFKNTCTYLNCPKNHKTCPEYLRLKNKQREKGNKFWSDQAKEDITPRKWKPERVE